MLEPLTDVQRASAIRALAAIDARIDPLDIQEMGEWIAERDPIKTPLSKLVQECALFTCRSLWDEMNWLNQRLANARIHNSELEQELARLRARDQK